MAMGDASARSSVRAHAHRQLDFTEVVLRTDAPGTRRKAEIAAREILPRCRELG